MSTASTTNVGIRLTLDGVQAVTSGLDRVQATAGNAAKALAGIAGGVFSAAAFGAWIKGAIDAADQTDELAQKTGLLAKEVAGLKLLFEQEGLGEQFATVMAKLSKEAAGSNSAFKAMGISVTDAAGNLKSTRDLLGEVAGKFAGYKDGAEKTALAIELFGKSGAELIPLLNNGASALDEFDQKARDLGLTLDGETAAAAGKFNDQMFLLGKVSDGLSTQLAAKLLPSLSVIVDEMVDGAKQGGALSDMADGLATIFERAAAMGIKLAYQVKQVGNEIGGLAAQAVQIAQLNFSGAAAIGDMMRADAERNAKAADAAADRILKARKRVAGVSGPNEQSDAEAYRLGLKTRPTTAPRVPGANGGRSGRGSASSGGDQFATEREAAKAWADAYQDFAKIARDAQAESLGLSKAQARLVEYLESPAYKQNSQEQREIALQQAYTAINAEQAAEALKKEREELERASNAMADRIEQEQAKAAGIQEQVKSQKQATEEYGLSAQALAELEAARLRDAAAEADRQARMVEGINPEWAQAYRDQAAALRELADAKINDATVRQQGDAYRQMWEGVEGFASNAFMSIAENGAGAFKSIGQALKREVIQALYEMTVKKWIVQIATGGSGGAGVGAGDSWMTQAIGAAYKYYTGGGTAAAGASAAGAAGSYEAAAETALKTSSVYAGETTAATGSSWMSSAGAYAGYAALIYAAVQYAQKLYAQGYNREALGVGSGTSYRFGNYSSYQSDPRYGNSALNYTPGSLMASDQRKLNDALGMSQKWSDILSGTTRMATLVGRRLSEIGLQADIVDGQTLVSGYAKYKGGVFRSNKTVGIEADSRDTALLKSQVEALQNGTKSMAIAMGYSAEAVEHYTGKLKVNFKGVTTQAEASERLQQAMDDLQFSMLKAAAGGKLSRDEFDKFMTNVKESIQAAGISAQGLGDIMVNGMMQGLSGEEIGAQLSQMVIGGIYQTIAQQAFAPVAASIMAQIVTPVFTALAAGVPVAQAVSQMAIDNIVASAEAAAEALKIIFNSEEFQKAMADLGDAFAGIGNVVGGIEVPSFDYQQIDQEAENRAREREQLEREILRLQGKTTELRALELLDVDESNRALKERVWALEDEAAALDQVKELQSAWTDLTGSIEDEIKRLRGLVAGETSVGLAYAEAQFAIANAQARAMDQTAAGKLPGLSGTLSELYLNTAGSRSEYQSRLNQLAATLEETNRITRGTAGIGADNAQKVTDQNVADKIELLQKSIDALKATMDETNKTSSSTAKVLTQVTNNGNAMKTVTA